MKIKEIIEEKPFHKKNVFRKYLRKVNPFHTLKTLFVGVAAIGLLCVGSYFYGNNSQHDHVKFLQQQLNAIHIQLEDIVVKHSAKREISDSNAIVRSHHVVKRNPQDQIQQLAAFRQKGRGGITYTRWGRRDCPELELTTLVYDGIAATTHYTHTGGGSNIMCLDLNVDYQPGQYVEGNQDSSHVYGVEYAISSSLYGLLNLSLIEQSIHVQNVPCAVCMATQKSTQLMIPARHVCPDGWTKEYTGYIMSDAHSHKHTGSFICVDDTPQAVPGSGQNHAGAYLYMSETQCPSVQCEPFVTGRELRCVVCSI